MAPKRIPALASISSRGRHETWNIGERRYFLPIAGPEKLVGSETK